MKKYLVYLSIILNVFFIFFFAKNTQRKTIKEISDGTLENLVSNDSGNFNQNSEISKVLKSEEESIFAKVTKVIDGDTVVLDSGDNLRYIGIDAPEFSQNKGCFFEESTNKNKELVLGKFVRLEKDVSEKDRYGRILRYVYVDGENGKIFVNEYLVRNGFAKVSTFPPDIKYQDLFTKLENQAKEKGLGLWGKCEEQLRNYSNSSNKDDSLNKNSLEPEKSGINCFENVYNCSDFKTQSEAQAVFEACGGSANDIHRLDADKDGRVCESLP